MTLQQKFLQCKCGYKGRVSFVMREPELCPVCEQQVYRQLSLEMNGHTPPPPPPRPSRWGELTKEQRERVEQYISFLLAEQPRLF